MSSTSISIPGASLRAAHTRNQRAYLAAYTPETIAAMAARPATPSGADAALIGDSLYLPRRAVAELLATLVETALKANDFAQVEAAIRTATDGIVGAAALSVGRNVNLVRKGGCHD